MEYNKVMNEYFFSSSSFVICEVRKRYEEVEEEDGKKCLVMSCSLLSLSCARLCSHYAHIDVSRVVAAAAAVA